MKDEECDWQIYHLLPEGAALTREEICSRSGLGAAVVDASLKRLEHACLICCTGESARLLSFGEALIQNQFKYEKDLPFTLENGVIKARKN